MSQSRSSHLICFYKKTAAGNEPDHYLHFTPENYTEIFVEWSKNISDALGIKKPIWQLANTAEDPLWPYDTPAANAQLDCVSSWKAGANKENTVRVCAEHTYQYSVSDGAVSPSSHSPHTTGV